MENICAFVSTLTRSANITELELMAAECVGWFPDSTNCASHIIASGLHRTAHTHTRAHARHAIHICSNSNATRVCEVAARTGCANVTFKSTYCANTILNAGRYYIFGQIVRATRLFTYIVSDHNKIAQYTHIHRSQRQQFHLTGQMHSIICQ